MKFLVIGETCKDEFCYGKANRLCPEAPVPVFIPDHNTSNLGMAANVYENMRAMDKETFKDMPFENDIELYTNFYIGAKTRYIDLESNQMFLRVDTDKYEACEEMPKRIEEVDAVIVSDYDKGYLTDSNLREIASRSKLSFLDTKKKYNQEWANLFTFIKINDKEYKENGWTHHGENLIITKGSKGCWYNGQDYKLNNPSEVRDVSGAGDTFLAGFAYSYTATEDIESSIIYAQDCCQRVIKKKGVATI